METAVLSCAWRCFSFGFAACMTSFDFWSDYIPHLPWKLPSADETTSKFAFFAHNIWSFLISFYLIIKKNSLQILICRSDSWQSPSLTSYVTDLETEARRGLVTVAPQRNSVFSTTQGAAFILI